MYPKKKQKVIVFCRAFKNVSLSSDPSALDLASLTRLLSERAKEFLAENKVQTFYQQELEIVESLLSLANQPVIHGAGPEQVSAACPYEKFRAPVPYLQLKGMGEHDCGINTERADPGNRGSGSIPCFSSGKVTDH